MTSRPHLVLVSNTALDAKNGSSRVELALSRALSSDFAITLLTRDRTALTGEPFEHRTYARPSSKAWRNWLFARQVAERLAELDRERRIDLLHGFAFAPVCFYAAAFVSRRPRPVVLTHHDFRLVPGSRFLAARQRAALSAARCITALSEAQKEAIAALGVAPERITVIPNGVALEEAAPAASELPERYFLFAGRLEPEKGIHLLLDALEAVPASRRVPLVIAGDGKDAARVRARAAALGAVMLGWVPHAELLGLISRAAAVLVPSFAEASPLVPLEAFARGVPVLIHRLPELRDQLHDAGGSPLATLIEPGDPAAWSAAIDRFTPDRAQLEKAREFALDRTWPRIARRYALVYAAALSGSEACAGAGTG